MSQLETSKKSPQVFSFTFGAMVAGESPAVVAEIPNFFPGTSKVLGVSRITAGASPGQPYLYIPAVVAGSFPKPELLSKDAGDTGVYRMLWVNEKAESLLSC
jgi:hypothetical protein